MPARQALPIFKEVGGYWLVLSRDNLMAVLGPEPDTLNIMFRRPSTVELPQSVSTLSDAQLNRLGKIPLDALPEFGDYEIMYVREPR